MSKTFSIPKQQVFIRPAGDQPCLPSFRHERYYSCISIMPSSSLELCDVIWAMFWLPSHQDWVLTTSETQELLNVLNTFLSFLRVERETLVSIKLNTLWKLEKESIFSSTSSSPKWEQWCPLCLPQNVAVNLRKDDVCENTTLWSSVDVLENY